MRVRRLFFVASSVVLGAVLMSACGAGESTSLSAGGEQVQGVAQVGIDEASDIEVPDSDAIDASAPAVGYKSVVVAADQFSLSADGVVSWVPGEISMGDFGPEVVPSNDGTVDSAPLHEYAEFATPTGCEEPYGDVNVDANGVGLTACEPTSYFYEPSHYAPMIWLDEDGRVVKIADRYHP